MSKLWWWAAILFFVTLMNRVICKISCESETPKTASARLKKHLFCEYDPSIRPVMKHETPVNVSLTITPMFMDFTDWGDRSVLTVDSWTYMTWKDEHLTWKPDDFEGVKQLRVASGDLWTPDISVYDADNLGADQTGLPATTCILSFNGNIVCVPAISYSSVCIADYTYWPFDEQTCRLRIGSWTHSGEEINIDFRKKAINMDNFTPSFRWHISNYTAKKNSPKFDCCPNETFPHLIAEFKIERHSQTFQAVYVTPIIILMVLTITVFWLDSNSIERISLATVNFVCHLEVLHNVNWAVPSNGSNLPHILMFYRNSMLLATFSMLMTGVLRKLLSTKARVPEVVYQIVNAISTNRLGQVLLIDSSSSLAYTYNGLREGQHAELEPENDAVIRDNDNRIGSVANAVVTKDSAWKDFADVIRWLSFYMALSAYLFMFLVLVPKFGDDETE